MSAPNGQSAPDGFIQSFSVWLRLHPEDSAPLRDLQLAIKENMGGPDFLTHITMVPGLVRDTEIGEHVQAEVLMEKLRAGIAAATEQHGDKDRCK